MFLRPADLMDLAGETTVLKVGHAGLFGTGEVEEALCIQRKLAGWIRKLLGLLERYFRPFPKFDKALTPKV
jgi:hypothetical protein